VALRRGASRGASVRAPQEHKATCRGISCTDVTIPGGASEVRAMFATVVGEIPSVIRPSC
jgi:hypothetical protein